MSFQITINKNELYKFEAVVSILYNEYNWIALEEYQDKVKIQLVLFREDKADEIQEAIMQFLKGAHIVEVIGG